MAAVSDDEIRALASLCRLRLEDEEIAAFGPQIAGILAYLQRLQAVDVEGVEPFVAPEMPRTQLRGDVPADALPRALALAPAAASDGVYVLAPQFKDD